MKLYVYNKDDRSEKIYIYADVSTRSELELVAGGPEFLIAGIKYSIYDAEAEAETGATGAGAIIGGIVGLLGGPIGVIASGSIGAMIGDSKDKEEINKANRFNAS